MKGVVFTGDRQLEIRNFEDPTPGPGEVVLEMKASGMCGSDLHAYRASVEGGGIAAALGLGKDPGPVIAERKTITWRSKTTGYTIKAAETSWWPLIKASTLRTQPQRALREHVRKVTEVGDIKAVHENLVAQRRARARAPNEENLRE